MGAPRPDLFDDNPLAAPLLSSTCERHNAYRGEPCWVIDRLPHPSLAMCGERINQWFAYQRPSGSHGGRKRRGRPG